MTVKATHSDMSTVKAGVLYSQWQLSRGAMLRHHLHKQKQKLHSMLMQAGQMSLVMATGLVRKKAFEPH